MSNQFPTQIIGKGATSPGGVKRAYSEFRYEPLTSKRLGGAATGTAADRNNLWMPGEGQMPGLTLEWTVIGTQTILTPVLTAVGLDLGMDQTSGDGLELCPGVTARCPQAWIVGTEAFNFRVTVTPEDVSGFNPLIMGFRKVEAFATDWNDYNDLAAIGLNGTAGDIKIATILANAATVTTDTTQDGTDATALTLEVQVSLAGVVTYRINDAAPTVTAAYSFASGLNVVPFLRAVHAADVGGKAELALWDNGPL